MNRRAILVVVAVLASIAGLALWLRNTGGPEGDEAPAPAPAARARQIKRTPPWPPDTAAIPGMLRDRSWRVRLAAANALRDLTTMSKQRRASLLVDALDREAAAPDSAAPVTGSYVPLTTFLRLQYVGLLEDLGPDAAAAIQGASPPATAAGREWRAVALAASGRQNAAPPLRPLVSGSSDFAVRMSAAHFLGDLEDRGAIPVLRKALTDPATAQTVSDMPGAPSKAFYPVRQQAARALRVLGLKVERRGDTYSVQ